MPAPTYINQKGLDPYRSHGRLLEQGKADMYNACEWGNYCRVQDTGVKSRQLGRRSVVTFAAIIVPPNSPVYTPQQLAHRKVGVPFYFGTHYLALHMLEGFLKRDDIKGLQRAARLTLSLRPAHERRNRRHHDDRAVCLAGGEERLPHHLHRVLSRHPGRHRQRSMSRP